MGSSQPVGVPKPVIPAGRVVLDPGGVLAETAQEMLDRHVPDRAAGSVPIRCRFCGRVSPCPAAWHAVKVCAAAGLPVPVWPGPDSAAEPAPTEAAGPTAEAPPATEVEPVAV